jgi:hypothetical protein
MGKYMKKSISFWQMIGCIVTGVGGTLLHFLYDWTGQNPVVGAFSAVNESIWEHMKLLFFPMLTFSVIEYIKTKKDFPNFWCVKFIGTLLGMVTIPVIYYTYTGALGLSADWFNISIFFIAAAAVYWLETKLLQQKRPRCRFPAVAFGGLLLIGIIFIMLTYFPPKLPLFQSPG